MCRMSPPLPHTHFSPLGDSLPSISKQPGSGGCSAVIHPTHAAPAGPLRI